MIYIAHMENGQPLEASDRLDSLTIKEFLISEMEGSVADLPTFYKIVKGEIVDLRFPPSPSFAFDYILNTWVDQRSDLEKQESSVVEFRLHRNAMLAASDWTQVADAPVDRLAWAEYRQALRDLPANTPDPRNPDWPTPPSQASSVAL